MQNTNLARLKDICIKILEQDPKVRYVGIISPYGKTVTGKIRQGIKPLFKTEEAMNEFFLTAVRAMLRKPFEDSLGKHILTLTMHEDVNIIELSTNKHVLYITFEKDANFDEIRAIAEKARALLDASLS